MSVSQLRSLLHLRVSFLLFKALLHAFFYLVLQRCCCCRFVSLLTFCRRSRCAPPHLPSRSIGWVSANLRGVSSSSFALTQGLSGRAIKSGELSGAATSFTCWESQHTKASRQTNPPRNTSSTIVTNLLAPAVDEAKTKQGH